jgi:hypothetical protein
MYRDGQVLHITINIEFHSVEFSTQALFKTGFEQLENSPWLQSMFRLQQEFEIT